MSTDLERKIDYWIFSELLTQESSENCTVTNLPSSKDEFIESFIDEGRVHFVFGNVKREYLELLLLYRLKSSGIVPEEQIKSLGKKIENREKELVKEDVKDYSERLAIRSLDYRKTKDGYLCQNYRLSPLCWLFEHIEDLVQAEDKESVIPLDNDGLDEESLSSAEPLIGKIWDDYSQLVERLMSVVPKNGRTKCFRYKIERQLKCFYHNKEESLGIQSFYLNDLRKLKELVRNGYGTGDSDYEKKVLAYVEGKEASGRKNISPNNEAIGDVFKDYLLPSKAPCGTWPSEYSPYLMQQLAINVFHNNKAPILSVNGPPGTGKTTVLKQIISDQITQKAFLIAEMLEDDCDPDKLFDKNNVLKDEYKDLYKYGIIVSAGTNFAVTNVTDQLTEELSKADTKHLLPFAAILGNSINIKEYQKTIKDCRALSKPAEKYRKKLKELTKSFLKDYRQLRKDLDSADNLDLITELTEQYTNKDSYEAAEKSNPGLGEFNERRTTLFLKAWSLHQYFALASNAIRANFSIAQIKISSSREQNCSLVDIYNSLFLVSPVITSTMASVGKLFRHLDQPSSLGLLISDESGQISPQCSMGALFRVQRAVVVGDPKQIPPVVPDDMVFAQYLAGLITGCTQDDAVSGGNDGYSLVSFQTNADRINEFGKQYSDGSWIGIPFVLHSRCGSPMFEISNEMSYENSMINVSGNSNPEGLIFDKSYWINVKGREKCVKGNHFVKRQADVVFKLILHKYFTAKKINEDKPELNLFVITPFRSVMIETIDYLTYRLKNEYKAVWFWINKNKWMEENIGTIHTFQGKETDEVILLLGCSEDSVEAAGWIYTNIVNVAVTRAKKRCYIVGDMDLWRSKLPNSPVNKAREIMMRLDKDYKIGLSDINRLLGSDETPELSTRREKDSEYDARKRYLWFRCPKCGSPVICCYEKGEEWEWKCTNRDNGCNLVFQVDGVPLTTTNMRTFLGTKKERVRYNEIDLLDNIGNIYWVYPHKFTDPDENGNIFFKTEKLESGEIFKRTSELLSFADAADKLSYHNYSFPKNMDLDYFGRRILDVIFTLYDRNSREGFTFNSLDVSLIMQGYIPSFSSGSKVKFIDVKSKLPKSNLRKEIDDRLEMYIENNYLMGIVVEPGKGHNTYRVEAVNLFERGEMKLPEKYVSFPVLALNDANENGGAFPVKCEWIELKFYILARIANMYNIRMTTRRIRFQAVIDARIKLPEPQNRMDKKRFIGRLGNFLDKLVEQKMIIRWRFIYPGSCAEKKEAYCGLSGIEINYDYLETLADSKKETP